MKIRDDREITIIGQFDPGNEGQIVNCDLLTATLDQHNNEFKNVRILWSQFDKEAIEELINGLRKLKGYLYNG